MENIGSWYRFFNSVHNSHHSSVQHSHHQHEASSRSSTNYLMATDDEDYAVLNTATSEQQPTAQDFPTTTGDRSMVDFQRDLESGSQHSCCSPSPKTPSNRSSSKVHPISAALIAEAPESEFSPVPTKFEIESGSMSKKNKKNKVGVVGTSTMKEMELFQVMDNHHLHQWPFVAVALIHIRLLLFQLTYGGSNNGDATNWLISLTVIAALSFVILLFSQYARQYAMQDKRQLVSFDNAIILALTLSFSCMLLLLNFYDNGLPGSSIIETHSGKDAMFQRHTDWILHNEFLFYVMMMPYLLYCRNVHASAWAVYLSWGLAFLAAVGSVWLMSVHDHALDAIPFAVSLILVSQAILINNRRKRVNEATIYRQFEDLKTKYNALSKQLDLAQKELVTLRHSMANTAHDMKTVRMNSSHMTKISKYILIV